MPIYEASMRRLGNSGCLVSVLGAAAVIYILACSAFTAQAEVSLTLPIRCVPDKTCWIANYVDVDQGQGARDFACGNRTYDGHNGTDFALRDLGVMRRGVDVLAAAPGIVKGTRDGMADVNYRKVEPKRLAGRECGNGVRLDHGAGWTTQYCHLRKGSVVVRKGQRIRAGQPLGKVGLSGKTIFPHLHFQVAKGETMIDPFIGPVAAYSCGVRRIPLWEEGARRQLPYRSVVIYNAGISMTVPNIATIRAGRLPDRTAKRKGEGIYLWADILGVEPGDEVTFSLKVDRQRPVFDERIRLTRRRARQFLYVGKKAQSSYAGLDSVTGYIAITRKVQGTVISDSASVGDGAN
jgi:murein DD-endopeptidase MepM/ murein hydrolase activator NlpD